MFADWLREHREDRRRYAALKRGLVSQGLWGQEYTNGKAAFVRDIVARARAAGAPLSVRLAVPSRA